MTTSRSTMRTPLAKVRGLGSAKSGTGHFWHQRLTAMAQLPLTVAVVIIALMAIGRDHAGIVQLLANPCVAVILLGFMLSISIHMRLGMQVVIEDYVHGEGTKVILVALNTFFAIAVALASAYAILKIAFHA